MKTKTRLINIARAFTRVELLAVLGALGLLAALALPGLANHRTRFDRVACVNNLRMVGQAFHTWGNDHGGETPWWVDPAQGGTRLAPQGNSAWFHFSAISNQLASPQFLLCPADWRLSKKMATNWGTASGGFRLAAYRDNATTYFVGLHAKASQPAAVLSGDNNLRVQFKSNCSVVTTGAWQVTPGDPTLVWTNGLHELSGNLLLNDGRVHHTTSAEMSAVFTNSLINGETFTHLLIP